MLISYAKKELLKDYIPTVTSSLSISWILQTNDLKVFDNYVVMLSAGNDEIELSLWDTTGQEEYDRLRPLQ